MATSRFFYVTYIRTTPEKLWEALTKPEFTRQWWNETVQDTDWKVGSDWKLMIPDGRVGDSGKILELDPPRRLVVSWRNEFIPALAEEKHSRCTIELEPQKDAVKLTLIHELDMPDSKLIAGVSQGWPALLASLKSLLETGEPLEMTRKWPEGV
jgi:uncharacterized protein YndB with AHSA1/START domain